MSRLTDEQRRITAHLAGPAAVIAVPGSGKTTALLGLINDLKTRGQDPRRILCVTFTKAAADQMRPRLAVRTGEAWAAQVDFRTLHSFAFKVLSRAGEELGGRVIDDPATYLRPIMQQMGFKTLDAIALEHMATDLSRYINTMRPAGFLPESCHRTQFDQVLARYAQQKQERGLVDMDDLVEQAVARLTEAPEMQGRWQRRYDWHLVDEHQDTSPLQWRLLQLVTPAGSPNLVVVGDDDQSIYAWRGGTNAGLLHFGQLYPDAMIYPLSVTHRCPKEVLQPAAALIDRNEQRYRKEIRSERTGGTVEMLFPSDPGHELQLVMNRLKQWHRAGENMRRFAILYRTNVQALGFISRLEEAGIPYGQLGGIKDPFSRWMARDVLSYLRVAYNQGAYEDLERIVRRPQREGLISRDALALLERVCKRYGSPLAALNWVAENGGFLERTSARDLHRKLLALREKSAPEAMAYILTKLEYGRGLEIYCKWSGSDYQEAMEHIQALSLLAPEEAPASVYLDLAAQPQRRSGRHEGAADGVCLSTMHRAKGLEWQTVFIVGAVATNHPRQSPDSMCDEEEERRLFYVAMTRAKEELIISAPRRWGQDSVGVSPFLVEAGLVQVQSSSQGLVSQFGRYVRGGRAL